MPAPKKFLSCLAAVLAVGAITTPGAPAATTIGNTCVATTLAAGTLTQLSQVSSLPLTAPESGVITKWGTSVIPYPGGVSEKLKVLRPTGAPNTFQVIRESSLEPVVGGSNTFSTQLPIQAGDRIGASGSAEGKASALACAGGPGDVIGVAAGDQGVGANAAYSPTPEGQVPLTATIEPDVDKDGFGDETQDKCPTSAAQQNPCPILKLKAVTMPPGKGSIRVLVASDAQAAITVSASAKVKKGKKTVVTQLSPVVQLVSPGEIITYTINFNKALKDALKALPKAKSINLEIVAEGKSLSGAGTTERLTAKVKGQAKAKPQPKR
jgi:hypothetical protein